MKKTRRKIPVKVVESVDSFGYVTDKELHAEFEFYEPENYNPLENIEEKEIVIPNNNKTETITMRFTKDEYDIININAKEKKVSKSTYLRMMLFNAINQKEVNISMLISEINDLKSCIKEIDHKIEKTYCK